MRKNWKQLVFVGLSFYLITFIIVTYNYITIAFMVWCFVSSSRKVFINKRFRTWNLEIKNCIKIPPPKKFSRVYSFILPVWQHVTIQVVEGMEKKSIKLNFIMNAILTVSSFLFPLITFPYVSRILLPEGTGKVSFATSVVTYFMMLSQLGIPMYGIRACAKVRDDREALSRTVHELLVINLVL